MHGVVIGFRLCYKYVAARLNVLTTQLTGQPELERGKLGPIPYEERYYYRSFEVGTDHIREIVERVSRSLAGIAEDCEPQTSFAVATKTRRYDFDSLDRVIDLNNSWAERIRLIKVTVTIQNPKAGALVLFADFGPGYSLAILAEGVPYNPLQELVARLDNTVRKTVTWYSILSDNRVWYALYLLVAIVFGIVSLVSLISWVGADAPLGTVTYSDAMSQPVTSRPATVMDVYEHVSEHPAALWKKLFGIAYAFAFAAIIFTVRPMIFPKGQFLIGRGIRRAETLVKVRWLVLTAIIVPLVIRIVLS